MKIAIVTGASSGMGREFVRQLADYVQVEEIWAIARRQEALEALKSETPVPVRPIVLGLLEKTALTKSAPFWKQSSRRFACWSTPQASANSALTTGLPSRTTAA